MSYSPYTYSGTMERPIEPKHSGLGIASFIMSIFVGLCMFVVFVVAGVLETSTPGGMDENSPVAMIVGLCMFGLLFGCLISIGLGIGGLCQTGRKKIFAVLGITFSAIIILGTIALIIIGLMMG